MDNEKCGADVVTSSSNQCQAEPGVTIPRSALRGALNNAERAVDEIHKLICDRQQERDNYVRKAGAVQEEIDRLRMEHGNRTSHFRALSAAVSP